MTDGPLLLSALRQHKTAEKSASTTCPSTTPNKKPRSPGAKCLSKRRNHCRPRKRKAAGTNLQRRPAAGLTAHPRVAHGYTMRVARPAHLLVAHGHTTRAAHLATPLPTRLNGTWRGLTGGPLLLSAPRRGKSAEKSATTPHSRIASKASPKSSGAPSRPKRRHHSWLRPRRATGDHLHCHRASRIIAHPPAA